MRGAVERAIETMWERYNEPISLSDLADAAILSRFYFSRVFRAMTGTSPGRFLAAIRLYQAKALLLETSISVTDISYHVGYNSPGTFTSRFTRSVGMSPTRYRDLCQIGILPPPTQRQEPDLSRAVVRGRISMPAAETPLRVYVGVFDSPMPEGMPVACDVFDTERCDYVLTSVPDGEWYVHAAAVEFRDVHPSPWKRKPQFVNAARSFIAWAGRTVNLDLDLHETSLFDLPILLALPELDNCELPLELAAVG